MATAAVRPVDLRRPEVIVDFTCPATIAYRDREGARFEDVITHDLRTGSSRRAEDEPR